MKNKKKMFRMTTLVVLVGLFTSLLSQNIEPGNGRDLFWFLSGGFLGAGLMMIEIYQDIDGY